MTATLGYIPDSIMLFAVVVFVSVFLRYLGVWLLEHLRCEGAVSIVRAIDTSPLELLFPERDVCAIGHHACFSLCEIKVNEDILRISNDHLARAWGPVLKITPLSVHKARAG